MINKNEIFLSVVSIGRNEASNLTNHIDSLRLLKNNNFNTEFIFVDSDSTDNSLGIAKTFFDIVISISELNGNLSASLGRKVGTEHSSGKWILYLDGDFELYPQFITYLNSELVNLNDSSGYTGICNYVYGKDKLVNNVQHYSVNSIKKIDSLMGALLLPLSKVINAGNWSSNLSANEEVDLQIRLEKIDCFIYSLPLNFILHRTDDFPKLKLLLGNIVPFKSYLGSKFYGPGQVLIQASLNGYLLRLLVKRREIYLTSLFQVLVICLCFIDLRFFVFFSIPFLLMVRKNGINRAIAFSIHLTQVVLGCFMFVNKSKINFKINELWYRKIS